MAIDSVSSAGNQPIQQPSETRVATDAKKAADQAAQTEKVAAQRQAEKAQQEQQAQQARQSEPPKPVVNTQGQVTGQLLNEVA
ncbi:MAG: hypothetical protein A2061_00825 [Gallionellales bacterium GWA2_59_43]|nr:MAG: hypothetical protein A2061_00825 [Gallionellales bacterium GWA2_59_43]